MQLKLGPNIETRPEQSLSLSLALLLSLILSVFWEVTAGSGGRQTKLDQMGPRGLSRDSSQLNNPKLTSKAQWNQGSQNLSRREATFSARAH